MTAFRAPLWVSPPPPPPPPAPAPPPPPLKIQLLAIVGQAGAYKAMVYDPERDAVLTVAPGDKLDNGRVVDQVDAHSLSIREPAPAGAVGGKGQPLGTTRVLRLDSPSAPQAGSGGAR